MEPVPCISEKVPAAQLRENRETGVSPVRFRRCNGGAHIASRFRRLPLGNWEGVVWAVIPKPEDLPYPEKTYGYGL